MRNDLRKAFKNKKVIITGGLGFIGSSLAIQLAAFGADVLLVDAMLPEYGGNLFNVEPIKRKVKINFADIRDAETMNYLIKGKDYLFHLAGQVSHLMSMTDPFPDIDINIKGTAIIMEACRHYNPDIKIVYTGTRGQYGPVVKLPVDENAPMNPKGIYEISNLTAEKIVKVYNDIHGIDAVLLRLTNIYGPRAQMKHSRYGVVNWFVRLAIDGEPIPIYGDGCLLRDFLYVDDCVEAILMSAAHSKAVGEIFNVGHNEATTFLEVAKILTEFTKKGKWYFTQFSKERKAQEPGDFYSDITKISTVIGWQPKTTLRDGLRKTLAFYKAHKGRYWNNEK